MELNISSEIFAIVRNHLFERKQEQVAFLFAKPHDAASHSLIVSGYYLVDHKSLINESVDHAIVSPKVQQEVIQRAWQTDCSLIEIHSHPYARGSVYFSETDVEELAEFVPHVWWRLKGRPYAALVFGQNSVDALGWSEDPRRATRLDILIDGNQIPITGISIALLNNETQNRQYLFFGSEGQEKIRAKRVAIVGLGGLGAHIVQQLAYLGVVDFTLIDDDKVTITNLNRLVGATVLDVGKPKVEIACRTIKQTQPYSKVSYLDKSTLTEEALELLSAVDIVFGCVDNDAVRLMLLETTMSMQIPYIDLATEIIDSHMPGGRVITMDGRPGCLMCHNELSQQEIRDYFASEDEKAILEKIYGLPRSSAPSPSVVMLNGAIASIGIMEFVALVTGFRLPVNHLVYRGHLGTVHNVKSSSTDCYYCNGLYHKIINPDLKRFFKN